ncbi:hypothetical protein Q7C36_010895 [Tachysurus vachellii]|uniref:Uncharacterized protein n=1 Tax=Tachysurus vachellii TaxID=175792 RepID=A0AA88MZ46_TACVA|nr:hypothetical protein Q7C36_010895 [Tachysurus vachellii]
MPSCARSGYFMGHGPLKGDPTRRKGRSGWRDGGREGGRSAALCELERAAGTGSGVRRGRAAGSERDPVNDCTSAFMARHLESI